MRGIQHPGKGRGTRPSGRVSLFKAGWARRRLCDIERKSAAWPTNPSALSVRVYAFHEHLLGYHGGTVRGVSSQRPCACANSIEIESTKLKPIVAERDLACTFHYRGVLRLEEVNRLLCVLRHRVYSYPFPAAACVFRQNSRRDSELSTFAANWGPRLILQGFLDTA